MTSQKIARRGGGALALIAASVLAATAFVAPSASAITAHTPVWDKGPGGERYVALGDSFASGPGIAPQRDFCGKSEWNFPSVVAATLNVKSFTDASCSGAVTADLTKADDQGDGTSNPPQLDALSADTTLVTFGTMGGNDLGLVQLAASCLTGECGPSAALDATYPVVRASLLAGVEEAARRAPNAKIVMVGYSIYLPHNGCPSQLFNAVTEEESNFIQGAINRLSDVVKDVAREKNLPFADLREIPGAVDHTVCAPPASQWIRGLQTYEDGTLLHPSRCGMYAMGQQVVAAIQASRGEKVPAFDSSCVSASPDGPSSAPDIKPVTPSTPPSVDPIAPPTVDPAPTRAERLAALRKSAGSVKFTVTCQGKKASTARTTLRVTGGKGAVSKVVFKAGKKKVAVDKKAPWSTKKKAKSVRAGLKKKSAKLQAVVTLRDGDVSFTRTFTAKRPKCLRA